MHDTTYNPSDNDSMIKTKLGSLVKNIPWPSIVACLIVLLIAWAFKPSQPKPIPGVQYMISYNYKDDHGTGHGRSTITLHPGKLTQNVVGDMEHYIATNSFPPAVHAMVVIDNIIKLDQQ